MGARPRSANHVLNLFAEDFLQLISELLVECNALAVARAPVVLIGLLPGHFVVVAHNARVLILEHDLVHFDLRQGQNVLQDSLKQVSTTSGLTENGLTEDGNVR